MTESTVDFNPRPSYEERRGFCVFVVRRESYFNPRPSYEERLALKSPALIVTFISIHAPHTRSDMSFKTPSRSSVYFNPRPSYEERLYQVAARMLSHAHFNPRPSYEERLAAFRYVVNAILFQSTPLIRGATGSADGYDPKTTDFNPRPSYEERHHGLFPRYRHGISIHAPHTRSDSHTFTPSFF